MQYDMPCGEGYYCPPGTSPWSYNFNLCPAGYFCPNITEDYPPNLGNKYKCAEGSTSLTGSTHIDDCRKSCFFCDEDAPCDCIVVQEVMPVPGYDYNFTTVIEAGTSIDLDCDFTFLKNTTLGSLMKWTEHYAVAFRADDTLKYGRDMAEQRYPKYFQTNTTDKSKILRVRYLAEKRIEVSLNIELYHGRFQKFMPNFTTACQMDIRPPSRAAPVGGSHFVSLLYKQEMNEKYTLPIRLPLNLPDDSDVIAFVDHATKGANMTEIFNDTMSVHQQRYWETAKADKILPMGYLPYFSNCIGFDSHIPIPYITEHPDYCTLPDSPTIAGPWNWFSVAVADTCTLKLECRLEEDLQGDSNKYYWYDAPEDHNLFHITAEPVDPAIYRKDMAYFTELLDTDLLIPVTVVENSNNYGKTYAAPKSVVLEMGYYQVDEALKQMVYADLSLLKFEAVPGLPEYNPEVVNDTVLNTKDFGYYTLEIKFVPLSWMELVNNFTYQADVFFILFVLVSIVAVSYAATLYGVLIRVSTLVKKPQFRFKFFATSLLEGPIVGLMMVLGPMLLFLGMCSSITHTFNPFMLKPANFLDGSAQTKDSIEYDSFGRFGLCMMIVGLGMVYVTSVLMVPDNKPVMSRQTDMWSPTGWKRAFVFLFNTLLGVTLTWLLEFAYSDFFGSNAVGCVLVLMAVEEVGLHLIESIIGEALLMVPGKMAVFVSLMVVTMGADDFEDFITGFFLEVFIGLNMKMFLDPEIAKLSLKWPLLVKKVQLWIYRKRGLHYMTQNVQSEMQDIKDDISAMHIEPMVENYSEYCNEILGIFLTPVIILMIYMYGEETKIPSNFGIRDQDMMYYFLFSVVVAIAEVVMNVFTFQSLEIIYGWPIFDYIEYAQHRFRTRKIRWRGHENSLDETLEPALQSIDNMCFSSQYYFVTAMGGIGICLIFLSLTIQLRANYSFLNDPVGGALILFCIFTCFLIMDVAVKFAEVFDIWTPRHKYKLKGEEEALLLAQEGRQEQETLFVQEGKLPRGALKRSTAKDIFLRNNQPWIFENLPYILTRKLLKHNRPFLTKAYYQLTKDIKLKECRFDISSDSDEDEKNFMQEGKFNVMQNGPITNGIMRFWLSKARQIRQFRHIIKSVLVTRKQLKCLGCGSAKGLQVEQLTEFESLMIGFNNERAEGFPGWDKSIQDLPESDQWRRYYDRNGRFRTLCRICRKKKEKTKPIADISADSSEFESDGIDIDVTKGSVPRKLLDMWLFISRRRTGYGNIPMLSLERIPRTRNTNTPKKQALLALAPVNNDISSDSDDGHRENLNRFESARAERDDISGDDTEEELPEECIFTDKEVAIVGRWLKHMKETRK